MRSCTCSTALIAISRGERWFCFLELDDDRLFEFEEDLLFVFDEGLRLELRPFGVLDSAIV